MLRLYKRYVSPLKGKGFLLALFPTSVKSLLVVGELISGTGGSMFGKLRSLVIPAVGNTEFA